jgi:mannan endo-1,4-beta-mannosidase
MKKIFVVSILCLFAGCNVIYAKTPAQRLKTRMLQIMKKGVMFGHQDDPLYGTTWKWDKGRSDVKEVCGDYPAVMGFELGKIELKSDTSLDGVPFKRMREEIIAQYKRGGIVTISWHPYNPVTGKNAWDYSGNAVKEILHGGSQEAKFNKWLNIVADFIKSLKTEKGVSIPVIFRPWHEMSGGWFWWGCKSCTPQEYKNLYQKTVNTMRNRGLNNIVWCYSPGAEKNDTEENYMKFYPGDEYVDVLGMDAYFSDSKENYIKLVRNELDIMQELCRNHNKIMALTETGYRNTPDAQWFTTGVLPAIKGYSSLSYLLFWRNAWNNKEENFGPAPEKECAKDFITFSKERNILFVNDIKTKN